jgi:hypothetical protein
MERNGKVIEKINVGKMRTNENNERKITSKKDWKKKGE